MADPRTPVPTDGSPVADGTELLAALRAVPAAGPLLARVRPEDPVWVVGGAVRDLLLGRTPRELDVLVVGRPVDEVAARLGEVVATHDRFGTATVETAARPGEGRGGEPGGGGVPGGDGAPGRGGDGAPGGGPDRVRYDVVRARRERYDHPGALPRVTFVDGVEPDLARRDVGVNAVAVRLADGRLSAVPGALEDLAAGRLRVLHDRSLEDDPTRAWRIARYAARLGFAPDARTRELLSRADPSTVSGDRHRRELRLALGEDDPGAVLGRLREWCPSYLPAGFDPRPRGLGRALDLLPEDGRPWLVRLAAMTGGVDADALGRWLRDLGLAADERAVVGAGSRESTLAPLRHALLPSEIRRAARGVPVELVALAGGEAARRWIDELRHVRLLVDGGDLLAAGVPPGPEVGRRLDRALDRKLDGHLPPADDQRAAELAAALGDEPGA